MRHLKVTAVAIGTLIALGALVAACSGISLEETTPVTGQSTVAVVDNSFDARVTSVPSGTEVTWNWDRAGRDHNVIGDGFQSQVQKDGTFTHTFEQPGTYDFQCTLHGGMTGRVIVTEG
jgi:plastocyanin